MKNSETVSCRHCGSESVIKRGRGISIKRTWYRQRYKCRECGNTFASERIPIAEQKFEYVSKPVPSQDWSAYTKAQNTEKLMLMDMLAELSDILQVEETKRVGRPRADLHEMIFCMALKTYTKLSSR